MSYQDLLADNEAWATATLASFPDRSAAEMFSFTKDGLGALFHRLEQLKQDEVQTGALYDATTLRLATCRRALKDLSNQEQDAIADSVEKRAGDLVSRGMAAEERMSLHRTRAIEVGVWRRRFESLVDDLDTLARLANTRHFALSAEREDIRAQIRAINLGIEIGEI